MSLLAISYGEVPFGSDAVLHQLELLFVDEITLVSVNQLESNLKLRGGL